MIEQIIEQFINDFNQNQSSIRELDNLNLRMQETMQEFSEPVQQEAEILQGFDFDSNDIDEDIVINQIPVEGEEVIV
jgi:hypothetical protein